MQAFCWLVWGRFDVGSGAWTADLIYAGGGMIAEVAGTQTATPTYRLLDHEGSLVMTTDGSGNVTGTNNLSPYGEVLSSTTTSDPNSYAGLYQDTEYGGDAATFRNYSTEQLRWTRPDPYNGSYDLTNPQSFNRYVYAMNNPLNNIDPSGLDEYVCQENGGCGWVLDDQYSAAQAAPPDLAGGLNAPSIQYLISNNNFGYIYNSDNQIVGTVEYLANYSGMNMFYCSAGCASYWTNADATVHGLAIATGAVAATPFVPEAASASPTASVLAGQALYNPAVWQNAYDFTEALEPIGPYPGTYAAFAGAAASSWKTIWNDVKRWW
ncbi:MAG: RHS repeat-associated core domain-containing protein [Acidobacteriaceae bacterium]